MANSNNIVLGAGSILVSTTVADTMPADTVAKGGTWGSNWVNLGYTGGVTAKITAEHKEIEVDQSTIGVRAYATKQEVELEVMVKEATLANLKYALGWGTLSTTGSTQVLTVGDNPTVTEYSVGLEGQSPNANAEFRRVQVYRAIPQPDVEMVMSREEETIWKMTWRALLHTSGSSGNNILQIRDYID
jgi:hypothetical protein